MVPGAHNFTAYAGATFAQLVGWRTPAGAAVDLNGYSGLMQIRDSAGTLLAELSTANGGIAAQADGGARLFLNDNATRALPPGAYRYDLLFRSDDNGVVTVLLQGVFRVLGLVTTSEPGGAG